MAQYVAVRALNRSANIRVITEQVVKLTVDATAGQIKLTVDGVQTANIAYNANAAAVQSALEATSNIAPGDVVVTGGPGDSGGTTPYKIVFTSTGAFAGKNVTVSVADGSTPASGGGDVQTVTTLTTGGKVKLTPTADVVVDIGSAVNRRALAHHSAVGQWVVTASNGYVGTDALPANS